MRSACSVSPESSRRYTLLARKAVFELKAGQAGLAEKYIAAAQEPLVEPTPLWLALLIEGIRYRLPKAVHGKGRVDATSLLLKRGSPSGSAKRDESREPGGPQDSHDINSCDRAPRPKSS